MRSRVTLEVLDGPFLWASRIVRLSRPETVDENHQVASWMPRARNQKPCDAEPVNCFGDFVREVPSLRGKLLQWNPSLSEENWVREVKNPLKMDVQFDDADRSGGSDRLTVEVISEFGLRSLSRGRAVQSLNTRRIPAAAPDVGAEGVGIADDCSPDNATPAFACAGLKGV